MTKANAQRERQALAPATPVARIPETRPAAPLTPADMISQAVASGAGIEVIERLAALHERYQAAEAKRAYIAALAAVKAKLKPIFKGQVVDFTSQKGRTNYTFEGLDDIARAVDPLLAEHGLAYRYRSKQEGMRLTVICVMAHEQGYEEETPLSADNDTSGNKNPIQAVGSAATFLQRYTLKLALGLATTKDDDAQSADRQAEALKTLTDAQVAELKHLADEAGADPVKFCEWLGADNFEEIRASQFEKAKRALNAKKQQAQREAEAAHADH